LPKRIQEDHKQFRDVVSGRTRKELKRLIKSGSIVRRRGKNGKMTITIPRIEIPHIVFGDTGEGLGRGKGKEGDVIGRDPQEGDEGGAGDQEGEGITITVDMEDVLRFMQDELALPELKPKPNETFEEVKIKYNDISRSGPESLRHTRRTMLEAIKRLAMMKELDNLQYVPSCDVPIKLITPINSDRRYRQYKEIKVPSSNAVVFFARDCSGSMDDYRCDIVSDMSWWIDCWIRKFYKKVERCYFVHDTAAEEVDEEKFYKYRYGGGTQCSSVFNAIAKQLENRYPPHAFNIYIFYFTDGDNWDGDNAKMVKIWEDKFGPDVVNLLGITQVLPWRFQNSVKHFVDDLLEKGKLNKDIIRTAGVGNEPTVESPQSWGFSVQLPDEERDRQIIEAIKTLLDKNYEPAVSEAYNLDV